MQSLRLEFAQQARALEAAQNRVMCLQHELAGLTARLEVAQEDVTAGRVTLRSKRYKSWKPSGSAGWRLQSQRLKRSKDPSSLGSWNSRWSPYTSPLKRTDAASARHGTSNGRQGAVLLARKTRIAALAEPKERRMTGIKPNSDCHPWH